MRLNSIKSGWKPVTLAVGMLAGGPIALYADVDLYSNVDVVINNYLTSKYIAEVNDPRDNLLSDKLRFENYLSSWEKNTCFLSSPQEIINQKDFQAIVAMGERAVPFIGIAIDVKPSVLVWALNLIYRTKITNNPNTTIKEACELWVKELKRQGRL